MTLKGQEVWPRADSQSMCIVSSSLALAANEKDCYRVYLVEIDASSSRMASFAHLR